MACYCPACCNRKHGPGSHYRPPVTRVLRGASSVQCAVSASVPRGRMAEILNRSGSAPREKPLGKSTSSPRRLCLMDFQVPLSHQRARLNRPHRENLRGVAARYDWKVPEPKKAGRGEDVVGEGVDIFAPTLRRGG